VDVCRRRRQVRSFPPSGMQDYVSSLAQKWILVTVPSRRCSLFPHHHQCIPFLCANPRPGVCLCFDSFLAISPLTQSPQPRPFSTSTSYTRATATLGQRTITLQPCPDYSKISSSTMTRKSAARYASRSSTYQIAISGRALVATKYAACLKLDEAIAMCILTCVSDMSVLFQQHQDDYERSVPCLSAAL
jgi:hypothetical protein